MTVDESGNENISVPSEEVATFTEIITDLVADTAIPGIPAPVRRNLFKALGQLTSAAIDFPVAFLTGKADEQRAETAARIKLINRTAEHIARQMQIDPEYARVAVQKFGHRVLREQVNLDMIGQKTATEIRDASDSIEQSKSWLVLTRRSLTILRDCAPCASQQHLEISECPPWAAMLVTMRFRNTACPLLP